MALFNVALMLSDRAPGFLRRTFADTAGRIAADRLPESAAVTRIAVWATATVLMGLTIWTWRGLLR